MTEQPDKFTITFSDPVDEHHVKWSRQHFDRINDGATWAVPRSGMIFVKRGDKLVLTMRMPHDPKMPISAEQLDEQQRREFANIKRHFEAAGITVEWAAS